MPEEGKQQLLAISLVFLDRFQKFILNRNTATVLLEEEIQTVAYRASVVLLNKFSRYNINEL